MVISNQAVWVLESTRDRWFHRLFGRWLRQNDSNAQTALLPGSLDIFATDGVLAKVPNAAMMDEGEAGLNPDPETGAAPLSSAERRARAVAVSALMRVRDRRFDLARDLFAEAASLDPALDLSTVPGFWTLPRHGQQAAVEAYELADRVGDAEMLAANLRYRFRPKLVRRHHLTNLPNANQ